MRGRPGAHGRNAFQVEARQRATIFGELAFALEDMDRHIGLALDAGSEMLCRRSGDGGVALNDLGDDSARASMPSESGVTSSSSMFSVVSGRWRDVCLHRRAERDDFVGIEFGVGFLPRREREELIGKRGHRRDAGRTPTSTTSSIWSACDSRLSSLVCRERRSDQAPAGLAASNCERFNLALIFLRRLVGRRSAKRESCADNAIFASMTALRISWTASRCLAGRFPGRLRYRQGQSRSAGCRCRRRRGGCRRWWR